MKTHDLKCWPDFFEATYRNIKQFEVRKNDRLFEVGDVLRLREWNPLAETYTGREVLRRVTYILHGGQFGIKPGYVVMAVAVPGTEEG